MPRRDFGSMLGSMDDDATTTAPLQVVPEPNTAPSQSPSPTPKTKPADTSDAPAKKPARRPRSSTASTTDDTTAGGVGYDKLERKETRLHERQIGELASLARQLNRQRNGAGGRITENTLIRLGVDLLLQRADELAGATEPDLAASLKLP